MKKAAVAIDAWKLSIFERHLKQAGYTFSNEGELSKDLILLRVQTANLEALHELLKVATAEAKRTGRQGVESGLG